MSARLQSELSKRFRDSTGRVWTYQEWLAATSRPLKREIFNGMCGYNRRRFNRMSSIGEQDAYMDRLKAKRYYVINGLTVSKTIFDSVDGIILDHTGEN